jgi:hypothetical protein
MTGEPILVPMLRHTATLLFLALVLCSYQFGTAQNSSRATFVSASPVTAIEIATTWNGTVQSPNSVVTIRSIQGGFKRSWDSVALAENNVLRFGPSPSDSLAEHPATPASAPELSQDIVTTNEVMALVTAVASPALLKPELSNLGISSAWLAERAPNAARTVGSLGEPNGARQQQFFQRSFTDLNLIGTLLPRIVGTSWTDDPVWVRVKIKFADGKIWTAETRNQPSFMLSWTVQRDGESFQTFNADISRAIAMLLPKGVVNRERLAGAGLDDLIVRAIELTIRRQWQQIGAKDLTCATLEGVILHGKSRSIDQIAIGRGKFTPWRLKQVLHLGEGNNVGGMWWVLGGKEKPKGHPAGNGPFVPERSSRFA